MTNPFFYMYQNFLLKSVTIAVLIVLICVTVTAVNGPFDFNVTAVTSEKDVFFEVSDTARVLAPPDTALVQVAVIKEGQTVEQVQTDLNTSNNKVIQAIREAGVEGENIKTVMFSINPRYRYNPQTGEQSIDGYMATSRLEVRITDFEQINNVIDRATQAGANEVSQVSFIVDDRELYVSQARQEAITNAKQKAQSIAKEAGINLGRLVDVQVSDQGDQMPIPLGRGGMDEAQGIGGGANVQPGQNEIQVYVQLFYLLED